MSTTRVVKGVFGICVMVTICILVAGIYTFDATTLNIPAGSQYPSASDQFRKSSFLQRLAHNVLEHSVQKTTAHPLTNENQTLSIIQRFSNSQLSNSSYGRTLFSQIEKRAKQRRPFWNIQEKEFIRDSQFLNYLSCPITVRKKMLQDTFTSQRFLPEMPILTWNDHFSETEYQRLSKFKGIYGWWNQDAKEISAALMSLNTPNNRYMFDDRLVDGVIPKDAGCTRCAIIGNGGMMNGSNKGEEIDANDYVFRVNVALTQGFEKDVGTKTSFYCFTMVTLSNSLRGGSRYGFKAPPYQKGIKYVFFADSEWTYTYLNAVLNGQPPPRSADKYKRSPPNFLKQLNAEDVKVVHPDFERYLKWSWVNSTAQHKSVHRPTTGAIMLLLALHTCDEVNVYGFGGSYAKFSEHYYDTSFQRHVFFANHDNNAENALWNRLHKLGIINLYVRN